MSKQPCVDWAASRWDGAPNAEMVVSVQLCVECGEPTDAGHAGGHLLMCSCWLGGALLAG